jgi:hypothetical protein
MFLLYLVSAIGKDFLANLHRKMFSFDGPAPFTATTTISFADHNSSLSPLHLANLPYFFWEIRPLFINHLKYS